LEAGLAPGPVWTGTENLATTGIGSSEHPAHCELLYQLHYPSPLIRGDHLDIWILAPYFLKKQVPILTNIALIVKVSDGMS